MSIKAKKQISFILISLTILLSYQNCAPVKFSQGTITAESPEVKSTVNPPDNTPPQQAPQTTQSQGKANVQPVIFESISYYFERPSFYQGIVTTSILSLSNNRSIISHSGYSYFVSFIKPLLKGSCMQNATCTNLEYFQLWDSLIDTYDTIITPTTYNNDTTYEINCSDPLESFLCKGIIKAANIKAAKHSQCTPRSILITPQMRTELEVRYDKSYSGFYTSLSIDKECLCVYDGNYSDPSFVGEVFHIKSPALDNHCTTQFTEYQ